MRRSACRYIEKGKQLNQKIMAKVTDVFVIGSLALFHKNRWIEKNQVVNEEIL